MSQGEARLTQAIGRAVQGLPLPPTRDAPRHSHSAGQQRCRLGGVSPPIDELARLRLSLICAESDFLLTELILSRTVPSFRSWKRISSPPHVCESITYRAISWSGKPLVRWIPRRRCVL